MIPLDRFFVTLVRDESIYEPERIAEIVSDSFPFHAGQYHRANLDRNAIFLTMQDDFFTYTGSQSHPLPEPSVLSQQKL